MLKEQDSTFFFSWPFPRIIKNIFDNAKTISNVRKGFKMANNHQINTKLKTNTKRGKNVCRIVDGKQKIDRGTDIHA